MAANLLNARLGLSVGPTAISVIDASANITATSLSVSTPIPVTSGGLGVATITGLLKGAGTSAVVAATPGTDYTAPGSATTFTVKQSFPAGSGSVSGSINIPTTSSGNTAIAGDLYGTSTGLQWHNGTAVKQVAHADGTNASGTWTISTSGTATTATNLAGGLNGSVPYQTGAGATTFVGIGTNGYILSSNGTIPTWVAPTGLSAGSSAIATNLANGAAGQLPYQVGANSTAFSAAGTTGQILVSGGTGSPTWTSTPTVTSLSASTITSTVAIGTAPFTVTSTTPVANLSIGGNAATATSATSATTATNLASGTLGSVPYQTANGATSLVTGNSTTTKNFFTQTGNGSVSAAPVWSTIVQADVGGLTTADTPTHQGLVLSGGANANTINASQTWNAGATTFKGIFLNVTNTASAAGSMLMDLQVGNVSKLSVDPSGNLIIAGNLTIQGTTTTVNTATLDVADINITIGKVAVPSDTTASGGGITLKGTTDKLITWNSAANGWESSENWQLNAGKTYRINGVDVLSATALGAGVLSSSLTSVGTLTGLAVAGNASVTGALSASYSTGVNILVVRDTTAADSGRETSLLFQTTSTLGIRNLAKTGSLSTAEGVGQYFIALSGTSQGAMNNVAVFNSTGLAITGTLSATGASSITNATASTSTTTGALVVTGGVGIGGALNVGGLLSVTGGYSYHQYNTANVRPSGNGSGLAIGWNYSAGLAEVDFWNTYTVAAATNSFAWNQLTSGATHTNLMNLSISALSIPLSTASTSTTTGALVVTGGVGIGGALNIGAGATFAGGSAGVEISTTGGNVTETISVNNTNASGYSQYQLSNSGVSGRTYQIAVGGSTSGQANTFYVYDNTAAAVRLSVSSGGIISIPGTTASTSTTTGALVVTGGVGIGGALNALTINGNTFTAGTGTLTIAAAKVLTVNNTMTLAGTDAQTYTFPATSATIARTDAANTFTGVQTFSTPIAVTSGGTGASTQGAALTNLGAVGSTTVAKSATYNVVAADRGVTFLCTGTWSLTFTAAATLANGFTMAVVNSGTGIITLDPNGAETIDGLVTKNLSPGQSCFITCNGSLFNTLGLSGGGAKGGGADDIFYENSQTVSTDYTISSGKNAMTAGPVTINTGITVTIPTGSVWTVV